MRLAEFRAVDWFYIQDGKKLGPFSESSLRQRIGTGEITPDTQVWGTGQPDWQPLRMVWPELSAPMGKDAHPAMPLLLCGGCGQPVQEDGLVRIEGQSFCADCKPAILQKLREGVLALSSVQLWRSGSLLIVPKEGALPRRCVRCGRSEDGDPIRAKVVWTPWWAICGSFVPFALIVALGESDGGHLLGGGGQFVAILCVGAVGMIFSVFSRKSSVNVSVCAQDRHRRQVLAVTSLTCAVLGVAFLFLGFSNRVVFTFGILFLMTGFVLGFIRGNLVRVRKIDKTHVWIKGVAPDVLKGLPEWPGK